MMMRSLLVKKGLLGGRSSSNLTLTGPFISLEVHPGKGSESKRHELGGLPLPRNCRECRRRPCLRHDPVTGKRAADEMAISDRTLGAAIFVQTGDMARYCLGVPCLRTGAICLQEDHEGWPQSAACPLH